MKPSLSLSNSYPLQLRGIPRDITLVIHDDITKEEVLQAQAFKALLASESQYFSSLFLRWDKPGPATLYLPSTLASQFPNFVGWCERQDLSLGTKDLLPLAVLSQFLNAENLSNELSVLLSQVEPEELFSRLLDNPHHLERSFLLNLLESTPDWIDTALDKNPRAFYHPDFIRFAMSEDAATSILTDAVLANFLDEFDPNSLPFLKFAGILEKIEIGRYTENTYCKIIMKYLETNEDILQKECRNALLETIVWHQVSPDFIRYVVLDSQVIPSMMKTLLQELASEVRGEWRHVHCPGTRKLLVFARQCANGHCCEADLVAKANFTRTSWRGYHVCSCFHPGCAGKIPANSDYTKYIVAYTEEKRRRLSNLAKFRGSLDEEKISSPPKKKRRTGDVTNTTTKKQNETEGMVEATEPVEHESVEIEGSVLVTCGHNNLYLRTDHNPINADEILQMSGKFPWIATPTKKDAKFEYWKFCICIGHLTKPEDHTCDYDLQFVENLKNEKLRDNDKIEFFPPAIGTCNST